MEGLISCFDGLKDHRACNARRHELLELLVIAQWTFLCGGESCVDMADFAEEKEANSASGQSESRENSAGGAYRRWSI